MSVCPYQNLLDPTFYDGGQFHNKISAMRNIGKRIAKIDDPLTGIPYWAVFRREECDAICKNPRVFSSEARSALPYEFTQEEVDGIHNKMFLNTDGEKHLRWRRIVRNVFTMKAVDSYEQKFRQHAKKIVDAVASSGECEFVRDVAAELPLIAILELCGVPIEDRQMFFEWTNAMLFRDHHGAETVAEDSETIAIDASMNMLAYAAKLAKNHKENPNNPILNALLNNVNGDNLSDEEFQWFFLMLISAGNESTRTVTTHAMRLLMEHPDQLQSLVDNPQLIPDAIEEVLRCNAAFMNMRRTAMEDIEIGGSLIKKDDKVVLFYSSINYDEEVFEDPMQFDITRAQRMPKFYNQHRAFGIGQHFCIGSHLARLEVRIILEEVIPRLRNPKFVEKPDYIRDIFINGIWEMPISFDAEIT